MANTGLSGKTFYGRNRKAYILDQFIKKGGEGQVYGIKGYPESVVKLYTSKKFKPTKYISDPRTHLKEKIETMLDNPVQTHLNGLLVITWPTDILFDSSGQFAGYVMPRVHAKKSLKSAIDSGLQKQMFPNFTWKTAIAISYNLAQAVDLIHSKGYVIGDMNELNFLLDQKGHITVIDTDSFNITNARTGKTYKCTVGRDELMPPELQGKDRSRPNTVFTKESDNFGLAIHIFSLLMNSVHPFGSVSSRNGNSTPSTSNGQEMHNIMNGICPYVTGGTGKPSKLAPDVKMLPLEIRNLFDRTFKYTATEAAMKSTAQKRAKASEWIVALDHLLHAQFSRHSSHVYLTSYGSCPWCELEKRNKIFYNPAIKTIKPYVPPVKTPAGLQKASYKISSFFKGSHAVSVNARRENTVLIAACVASGALISPALAQFVIPLIAGICGWMLPIGIAMAVLSICGALAGWGVAEAARDKYVSSYNAAPWLLLALLPPLLGAVTLFLLCGAGSLLWLILLGVFEILKVVLMIGLVLAIFAAFV